MVKRFRFLIVVVSLGMFLSPFIRPAGVSDRVQAASFPLYRVFLPLVYDQKLPDPPTLNYIHNPDFNLLYTVEWVGEYGQVFRLQESTQADFSDAQDVYQGYGTAWTTPSPKYPGTYYYRVQAMSSNYSSVWSNVHSVTIYPLFVGLKIRWDGVGYIRGSEYYDIGVHKTLDCNLLTEPETIQCKGHLWYQPNPLDFDPDWWNDYYSPITGDWKGSSVPDDPSWKWGSDWKLSYSAQFQNGQTVQIGGQEFLVTGPHDGVTTFGKSIKYWQFVNKSKFLFHDDGSVWTQYVHPGDAVLRYDAGATRLRIYRSVKRTYYYKGGATSDTVQYIDQLSSSTSMIGSPEFRPNVANEEGADDGEGDNSDEYMPHRVDR